MEWKVLIVTLVFGTVAFMTGSHTPAGEKIWPPNPDEAEASGGQTVLFTAIGALESIAFGLGIAFLIWGWPMVQRYDVGSKGLAVATYLSIAWLLINWYPHTNLHVSNRADDVWRLIGIEYGFHMTLVIAGFVVAAFFIKALARAQTGTPTRA